MQNNFKKKIFIIIFFFISTIQLNSSEQFNFNVTEIKITEDGNKFRGEKGGEVTTEDGIIINADNFDYNKITNILKANGNVKIEDTTKQIIIYSENITYLKDQEKIFTEKNSKAIHDEFIINADKFYYDKNLNILKAENNVKIDDTKKNIIITSENIEYLINKEQIYSDKNSKAENNEITITSEKFNYDRKLNIFNAINNVKIEDKLKDIIIYSEKITYFKEEDKILTEGKTNALIESKYDFLSKNVSLLRKQKQLSSSFQTKIISEEMKSYELDEFIYFIDDKLVKGINVRVNSNINVDKGKADHLRFENGFFNLENKTHKASKTQFNLKKDNFGNPENDPRMVGISSSSTENLTIVNKGIFTSCKKENGKCPPWSIKAEKVTHNRSKKQLIYDKAFLRVYDVPVMYFPKFFHPDPSVKRQSGFLKPQLNNSEILGSSLYLPYFKVISENKDLTFKPTIFDKNIYMIQNEYRQVNEYSDFGADISLTKGYKSSLEGSNKNSMSHLFVKFNKNLNKKNFTKSNLTVFGEKVSNDTYLKIFDNNLMETLNKPSNFNSLKSGIKIDLDHNDYTFDTGLTIYENLQTSKNSDRFQFVFPYYDFSTNLFKNEDIGGTINFSSSGSNRLIDTNNLKTEIGNSISYNTYDHIFKSGIKNNFNFYVQNSNKIAKNDSEIKSSLQSELRSIFEIQSSFPLIKKKKNVVNTIEPKFSFRLNPGDMNKYTDLNRKINADNVFNINRLGLGDSYEAGKSLTLGLNYKSEKIDDINKFFEFKLATVLRDTEEDRIPTNSTLNRKGSNLFGSMNYNLSKRFSLDYDFSLDNDLNTFEYNSLGFSFDNDKLFTKINFVEENGTIGDANSLESELGYNFDENNFIKFKTRRNRTLGLTEYYDLVYEYKNDCLTAGVKYKKSYYQDRDLQPKEDLLLSITFFPLSTFEQEIDQQLYRN